MCFDTFLYDILRYKVYTYTYVHVIMKNAKMKSDTEQTMKLEKLYKVDSECELNSWPDSSVD